MQLFVDMDGVLADFDRHHETVFGVRSDKFAYSNQLIDKRPLEPLCHHRMPPNDSRRLVTPATG